MAEGRIQPSNDLAATRLAIAYDLFMNTGIITKDPVANAKTIGQLADVIREEEARVK